jgi:predicted ferric reductase
MPVEGQSLKLSLCWYEIELFDKLNAFKLQIYVDGPYGAPSVHIFEAEHAVLIAGGIGVTPFASILQSIMRKVQNATVDCPNCQHKWVGMTPEGLQKLKKVC